MRSWMIAVVAGVLLVSLWPQLPSLEWCTFSATGLLILLAWRRWRLFAFGVGILVAWYWGLSRLEAQLPSQWEGKDVIASGRICSLPSESPQSSRFDLCLQSLNDPATGALITNQGNVRLSWYKTKKSDPDEISVIQSLAANQAWNFEVRLKRPHGFLNPAGFDYETWLFRQGYIATGYVRSGNPADLAPQLRASLAGWRERAATQIRQAGQSLPNLNALLALTLGEKGGLDDHHWQLLAKTGTSHLLVISGMHVGLFAGVVFALVRFLWLRMPQAWQRWRADVPAAVASVLAATYYLLLSGADIPAQRAFVMITVAMLAIVWMRQVRPFTGWCLALLLVVVLDPLAGYSAGFWLSFVAVAIILLCLGIRHEAIRGGWRKAWDVQWKISVLMMPLLLCWFGQYSLVSLPVNVLAIPLVSLLIVPLSLLGALVSPFSIDIASGFFWLADRALGLFWTLLELAAQPAWSAQKLSLPLWLVGCMGVLALALFLPRRAPGRWLLGVLIFPLVWPPIIRPDSDLQLYLWDVGQGLSVLVKSGESELLYDAGPRFSEEFDAGSAVVVPNLEALQVRGLEALVVSHGDLDHSGGLSAVVQEYPPRQALSGEPQRIQAFLEHSPVSFLGCRTGMSGALGEGVVHWQVLWPISEDGPDSNNRSCVMRFSGLNGSILLTGDISGATEQALVRRYGDELRSDLLVLAHHGSKYSTTPTFLNAVKPKLALVSAGYRNRFGHPAADTRLRLSNRRIPLFNTAEEGAVRVAFTAAGLQIETQRRRSLGYWHTRPFDDLNPAQ